MSDVMVACADLIGRAGGKEFQIGWICPHVPDEGDDHNCADVTWYAHATWNGARLTFDERATPDEACLALASRILSGARCRCGQPVALKDGAEGCRWQLTGAKWEASCDAEPIHVTGRRGDVVAMGQALNREQRRRRKKRR